MTRGFSLRFGLSLEGRLALVNLLKLCAGPDFDNLNLSNYLISRVFEPEEKKLTFCFYCPECKANLISTHNKKMNNPDGLCDKCGSRCNLSTMKGKYILMVDLKYQIEKLFKLDDVKTALLDLHRGQNRVISENNVIRDFQDGSLYKNVNPANANDILTLNVFFDGAVMKRSGTENFWAALIQMNELPIALRMKFIILSGLMMVSKEPQPDLMNTFIEELIKQIDLINENGVDLKIGGITLNFKFKILFVVADSVARPILQFRIQYNGFFGCSWCYQRGIYTNYVRYLFDPDFQIKTYESHKRDVDSVRARQARAVIRSIRDLRKTFVNGVKGRSSFLNLIQFFDMIWSFPLEYMHCILIGVVQHLWDLWIKLGYLSQKDIVKINELLSSLETVLENHRVMREFSSKAKWKATEWRCWLLFFGVPCFRRILPDKCLEHFALLVNTVFTLLKTEITPQELLKCELDMVQFVGDFEGLYGKNSITFNVHILLHLVESVRRSGPLWVTSAFCFESHLHVLKQYVLGPKKPEQQMATKALEILDYKFQTSTEIFHSEVARQYCEQIFSVAPLSQFATRTPYGVTFFGRNSRMEIENPVNGEQLEGYSFNKCIYRGVVYKSINNTLSTKRNDTVFILRSGDVIQIHDIIQTAETCYLSVVKFRVIPDKLVGHLYKIEQKENETRLISITEVSEKLIYIHCEKSSYVCRLPQNIEIQ
ncbi:uncharacterized protein LOC127289509 [Leptopilina boulardi]|uniref:uncharacterized protein LOC127289509 n=1 Tax=Leptopilina boulardi TaxID=63433 RepID=UPI0021F57C2E|nr:uncharacterized protein LOC127289509 [Leptopilina boulardi]